MAKKSGFSLRFLRFFAIFAKSKKIHKYKIFGAFWREPPVNIRADHGQIMGRSWADHGQIMGRSWADHGRWLIFKGEVSDYREKKLTIELTIVNYFHWNRGWQSAKKADNFLTITIYFHWKRSWQSRFFIESKIMNFRFYKKTRLSAPFSMEINSNCQKIVSFFRRLSAPISIEIINNCQLDCQLLFAIIAHFFFENLPLIDFHPHFLFENRAFIDFRQTFLPSFLKNFLRNFFFEIFPRNFFFEIFLRILFFENFFEIFLRNFSSKFFFEFFSSKIFFENFL